MIINKRGLSIIIGTLLIVLLTIAGIAIIASFVIPFVRDSLDEGTECFEFRDYYKFEEKFEADGEIYRYNCYDLSDQLHGASVRASPDDEVGAEVIGFDLVFVVSRGSSSKVSVKDGMAESCAVDEVRFFGSDCNDLGAGTLTVPGSGEVKTYVYNAAGGVQFDRMRVHPVLKDGRICDLSDEIEIRACEINLAEVIN